MSRIGNRPDCAYFLLLGLAISVFLSTIGGVLTYIAYWPDTAIQGHATHHHGHSDHLQNFTINLTISTSHPHPSESEIQEILKKEEILDDRIISFEIIGPICIGFGIIIAIIIGVLALKFDCDHEPEPNIAFLRLRSELSLISFDSDKKKYELMTSRNVRENLVFDEENSCQVFTQRY